MLSAIPQGWDGQASTGSGLWLRHSSEEDHRSNTCKTMCPLATIKGEPGHTSKADSRLTTFAHNTRAPSKFTHTSG